MSERGIWLLEGPLVVVLGGKVPQKLRCWKRLIAPRMVGLVAVAVKAEAGVGNERRDLRA